MPFKTEMGQQFPAEAFAYVGDPNKPETWALRMWESVSQKLTGAQVSRAVAALSATRAGRGMQLPPDSLPSVKEKLRTSFTTTHAEMPVPTVLKTFTSAVGDMKTFSMKNAGLPPLVKTDDGQYAVHGLKIFKTGTFCDSDGDRHVIDADYIRDSVTNFYALKESGVLPNVPWRLDHSRSVESVVGYFENVYSDPTGEFLLCDFAFTDDEVAQKYAKGKYRNRSIEIGEHAVNSGETYDPVIMGCAFVDLPAVEGLNSYTSAGSTIFPFQEIESMATFMIKGVPTTDEKVVQATLDEYAAAKPAVHEFVLGNAKLSDPTKVQEQLDRIAGFEAFMGETKMSVRSGAVDKAVKDNKIIATQGEAVKNFVASLNDEQFTAWAAQIEAAPVIAAFGTHMGDGNGDTRDPNAQNGVPNAVEDAKEQVRLHKIAGMSREVLEKTASFMTLKQAGVTVNF